MRTCKTAGLVHVDGVARDDDGVGWNLAVQQTTASGLNAHLLGLNVGTVAAVVNLVVVDDSFLGFDVDAVNFPIVDVLDVAHCVTNNGCVSRININRVDVSFCGIGSDIEHRVV